MQGYKGQGRGVALAEHLQLAQPRDEAPTYRTQKSADSPTESPSKESPGFWAMEISGLYCSHIAA